MGGIKRSKSENRLAIRTQDFDNNVKHSPSGIKDDKKSTGGYTFHRPGSNKK